MILLRTYPNPLLQSLYYVSCWKWKGECEASQERLTCFCSVSLIQALLGFYVAYQGAYSVVKVCCTTLMSQVPRGSLQYSSFLGRSNTYGEDSKKADGL